MISSWRFDHPLESESSWSFLAGIVAPISIDIEDCLPFSDTRGSVPTPSRRSPSTSFDDAVEPRTRAHHSDNAGGGGGSSGQRLPVAPGRIADTDGLDHSFNKHAHEWFGRKVPASTHFAQWQAIIERAAKSRKVFDWSTGADATIAHLARIDGKYFVVQFFKEGPRAGELATAYAPHPDQLGAMLKRLGK